MLTLAERRGIWFPFMIYDGQQLAIAGHVKLSLSGSCITINSNIVRSINTHPVYIESYPMNTAVPGATLPTHYRWRAAVTPWTDSSLVFHQKVRCFIVLASHQEQMLNGVQERVAERWRRRLLEMLQNQRKRNTNVNASQIRIQKQPSPPKLITCSGVCEDCITAAGSDQFHHCKLDAVVVGGYRTSFGPIGPWKIEPVVNVEPDNDATRLYSLFAPMPRVDNILQSLGDRRRKG